MTHNLNPRKSSPPQSLKFQKITNLTKLGNKLSFIKKQTLSQDDTQTDNGFSKNNKLLSQQSTDLVSNTEIGPIKDKSTFHENYHPAQQGQQAKVIKHKKRNGKGWISPKILKRGIITRSVDFEDKNLDRDTVLTKGLSLNVHEQRTKRGLKNNKKSFVQFSIQEESENEGSDNFEQEMPRFDSPQNAEILVSKIMNQPTLVSSSRYKLLTFVDKTIKKTPSFKRYLSALKEFANSEDYELIQIDIKKASENYLHNLDIQFIPTVVIQDGKCSEIGRVYGNIENISEVIVGIVEGD